MQAAPGAGDPSSIDFLDFRIDRRGGRLARAGETIALRPKTWAVLLYLAERPGMLVTREDLLDAVWPDVAVTPDTLTKSIGELRLALGDNSKTPRCIETVHRRGFRFIAETRVSGPGSPIPGSGGGESKGEASNRRAASSSAAKTSWGGWRRVSPGRAWVSARSCSSPGRRAWARPGWSTPSSIRQQ